MTIAQRAVRGTVYVLFSSYTNMGVGLFYSIVMARLLSPRHFGIIALGLFFYSLIDIHGKLGLDYAFIHRPASASQLNGTHWLLQVGAAALTCLCLLAALPVLMLSAGFLAQRGYYLEPEVMVTMLALGLITLIDAAGRTPRATLEKELAFGRSTVVVTGALLLSYAGGILLAWRGYTYWAILGQLTINAALTTLGAWWALRRFRPADNYPVQWDGPLARWMLRYSATMAVGALATVILLGFDNFLVGIFAGTAALGFYAQAYKTAQWPTGLVTHVIARTSMPTYAKVQADPRRLSQAFEMSLWMILTLALPLGLALFVAAPEFVRLLYGDKWLPTANLIRFLIGYATLRPLLDDTGALFVSIGQPGRITRVLILQALVLVVVATPLTWLFAAEGAAVSVGVAFLAGIGATYYYVSRTLPIKLAPLFGPAALAALAALGLGLVINQAVSLAGWPLLAQVLLKGTAVGSAYLLVAVLLQGRAVLGRVRLLLGLLRASQPAAAADS